MFTRKSVFVALTVIAMLAMLVPVASAAPAALHGVKITSPVAGETTAAYVNPEAASPKIAASVDFTLVQTQVDNVYWQAWLLQAYDVDHIGMKLLTWGGGPADFFKPNDIVANPTQKFTFPVSDAAVLDKSGELPDGWYSLKFCASDDATFPVDNTWCDVSVNSVLVQDTAPKVELEKPGAEDWQGATFVSGQDYYLEGLATDVWGVVKVEFQYCDASNFPGCNRDSSSWVTIAAGVPVPGVKDQYKALWDSSQVPDDFGFIRMCAWNHVGLSNCLTDPDAKPWDQPRVDAHKVFVNNRAMIDLEPGWNLISLPIMPYDPAVTNATHTGVLDHLIAHKTVLSVQAYDASTTPGTWMAWNESGPSNLMEMRDGQGYWVFMKAEDVLTVVGNWKNVGNTVPPEYPVYKSWNLIGYTHWGTPVMPPFPSKTAADYLSTNSPAMKAMWRYDATHEFYIQTVLSDDMTPGAGYWLALAQDGSINP